MTGFWLRASLAAALFATGAPALAADAAGRTAVLQRLLDCRKVEGEAARLACYDTAAGALDQAEAKGDVVVVDREQARSMRKQSFGFTLPSLAIFDRGEKPEDINRVTLQVTDARRDRNGKWVITVEGGQVWRQIDVGEFTVDPRPGMTASVRKASLGSFLMSIGGKAGVRVHRDE